eukprot:2452065-Pleurochrysis_carterae.AAC.3
MTEILQIKFVWVYHSVTRNLCLQYLVSVMTPVSCVGWRSCGMFGDWGSREACEISWTCHACARPCLHCLGSNDLGDWMHALDFLPNFRFACMSAFVIRIDRRLCDTFELCCPRCGSFGSRAVRSRAFVFVILQVSRLWHLRAILIVVG